MSSESMTQHATDALDLLLAKLDPECDQVEMSTVGSANVGLHDAQQLCHFLAKSSGWWNEFDTMPEAFRPLWIGTKVALIHSEASEALEGFRKGLNDDHLPHRKMAEVELADIIIRTLDLAGGLGMDLAGAVIEKLAYNQQRADHKLENRTADGGKKF